MYFYLSTIYLIFDITKSKCAAHHFFCISVFCISVLYLSNACYITTPYRREQFMCAPLVTRVRCVPETLLAELRHGDHSLFSFFLLIFVFVYLCICVFLSISFEYFCCLYWGFHYWQNCAIVIILSFPSISVSMCLSIYVSLYLSISLFLCFSIFVFPPSISVFSTKDTLGRSLDHHSQTAFKRIQTMD